jgi:cytochrome c oxidase assembly protein subunit 15
MLSERFKLYKKLALIAACLAFCVVALGAYVRLTDAGLGCPDWPGCYGTMTVPQSEAAIAKAQQFYPDNKIEVGKAWREMAHRYLAGTLGLLVLALTTLSWAIKREIRNSVWLTTTLLIVIMFQAALGMWTVTMLLKPAIVTAHLIGGMTTLAMLVWIAHRHWGYASENIIRSDSMKFAVRLGLLILALQIFLGGWTSTNYAALACTDFPTCHGAIWPKMDFNEAFTFVRHLGKSTNGGAITLEALTAIQWTHRLGALVTFIYLTCLSLKLMRYWQLKKIAGFLMLALVTQVILGVLNLRLHLPLVLAVAHNMVAASLVVIMIILNSKITKKWVK